MKHLFFTCSILMVVFGSCNNNNSEPTKEEKPVIENNSLQGATGSIMQLDERLNGADSLVFVFYKDPHGQDSLRYTRYYKQYHSTDTGLIQLLKHNLGNKTERLEKIKNCRSEGKIWCFAKGDVFQTIYFSAHNKECGFVYIIVNGQFYYSSMNDELAGELARLKPLAKESANQGK